MRYKLATIGMVAAVGLGALLCSCNTEKESSEEQRLRKHTSEVFGKIESARKRGLINEKEYDTFLQRLKISKSQSSDRQYKHIDDIESQIYFLEKNKNPRGSGN